jgi:hypothetical protein
MTNVIKCDVCGVYVEDSKKIWRISIKKYDDITPTTTDMCVQCKIKYLESMITIINTNRNTNRRKLQTGA